MSYFAGHLGATIDRGFVLVEEEPAVPPVEGYANTVNGLAGGGPIAYWRLGNALQITDEIGTRHGTYSGTPALVDGLPETSDPAVDLGGTISGEIPHDAGLSLSAFSLLLWGQVNALPEETLPVHILTKDASGQELGGCLIRISDNSTLSVFFQAPDNLIIESLIEVGVPFCLIIRADSTGFDVFLDGQLLGKNTLFTDAWASNTQPIRLAAAPFHARLADTVLDELAIYPRVITNAEALELSQVTANPVAGTFATGVPESAATAIDLSTNCTFVGAKADLTVTIVDDSSVVSAGHTVAVNGSNDAVLTASAVTSDEVASFTYKIEDANGESNTATCTVTVQDVGGAAPENANCYIESGASTVAVASMSALQSAVNAADPGDNILIAPGVYSGGTLNFNRDGTEANPIVIRPRDGLGTVTINDANWTFESTASWLVLSKLHQNGASIVMNGDHNRLTRNWFRGIDRDCIHIGIEGSGGARDCRIDHCEFSDWTAHTPAIRIRPGQFATGASARILMDYCYFHDATFDRAVIDTFVPTPPVTVDLARGSTIITDHCLFENCARSGEYIIPKLGGWIFRFNTFDDMNGYLQPRSGASNCEFRSNWFEGASHEDAKCWANNHLWIGNRFVGAIDLWMCCGNASWEDLKDGSAPLDSYNPATNCEFIGNRFGSGHILMGQFWSGCTAGGQVADLPANNNLIAANIRDSVGAAHQNVTTCLATSHTNTTISGSTSEPFVPAVKLTSSQVGLLAADPLCD